MILTRLMDNRLRNQLLFFWGCVSIISLFFMLSQFKYTRAKAMWEDENFSLKESVREPRLLLIITEGVPYQASPAPLDYILLKGLDSIREEVNHVGLQPTTYLRLASILITMMGALAAALMVQNYSASLPPSLIQILLILMAFIFALFQPAIYSYAGMMRPYALWNSIWFACLVIFFALPPSRVVSLMLLILLAFSATASIFQLFALLTAYLLVSAIAGRKWRTTGGNALIMFLLPIAVSLFYCLKAGQWGYDSEQYGTWERFAGFWLSRKYVGLGGLLSLALCMTTQSTRKYAVPSTAVLILYLMGPFIFAVTRYNGFFFTDRQYIYYELAFPIYFLTAAFCYSVWRAEKKRVLQFVCTAVAFSSLFLYFPSISLETILFAKQILFRADAFGVPIDNNNELSELLKSQLPKEFCLTSKNEQTEENVKRAAEWIAFHYRNLPVGNKVVHLEPCSDNLSFLRGPGENNARVLSISDSACSANGRVPIR